MQLFLLVFTLSSLLLFAKALPEVVRIGGLFDSDENKQEHAFQKAIERINSNKNILPRSKLVPQIEDQVLGDSFRANKKVCNILRKGVAAVFGPQSPSAARHIQAICDTMEVPHLETRQYKMNRGSCLVNLFPHPQALSEAYASIVKAFGWKNYAIIYEDIDDLVHLQGLVGEHQLKPSFITRLSSEITDYRPLLKKMKNMGYSQIVLDCSAEKTFTVLKQAQQLGMTGTYHSYLLTSLDIHTLDLDDFKYGGANLTAFKLINFDRPEFRRILRDWDNATVIKTETALMYDAVYLFAKALHDLDTSQQIDVNPINCDSTVDTFSHGFSLINYMKVIEIEGLSGLIKFDNQGFRTNVQFDVISLREDGIKTIGTWNSTVGLNFTRTYTETYSEIVESLQNRHFIITTILSAPYFMRKTSSEKLTGNDQFEGYVVDLTREISRVLGFNYTFRLVPDGHYGSLNRLTNEWDGMISELLEQRSDLVIADLTITYEREQAVDFTMPFMNLGISVLYRKPIKHPPNLFSFLSPLSFDVWLYMATAYLGVSLLLFILARFSPYEWENPHPCKRDSDILENQFSLINSLWFVIGTLMQQGSDIVPKALSTRIVAGTWWFFTLIMISSYTANLAAFLTVERMESPITSAEDLAKQSTIKYGVLRGGSTAAYFRDSNISTYQRMWTVMEMTKPTVFTESNQEGVERVIRGRGNYAFLMESTSIEYVTERNCELTQIGGLLDNKGYGIATPPNSPFRTPISSAILKLQEDGTLHKLKTRWWKEKRGGGSCKDDVHKSSNTANELTLASVGGVFVVLLAGLGIACLVSVGEFIWKLRMEALEGRVRVSFCNEMMSECEFALKCRRNKITVLQPPKDDLLQRHLSQGCNQSVNLNYPNL